MNRQVNYVTYRAESGIHRLKDSIGEDIIEPN